MADLMADLMDDFVEQNSSKSTFETQRKRIFTAPLPEPISKNVETVIALQTQEIHNIPNYQRSIENGVAFFGKPAFLYSLLIGFLIWICGDALNHTGILPFRLPMFSWADQGLDMAALVISTGVLVRQTRQESFAEQRSQLALQLDLLSEQKIAKIIALLEELRTDLPQVSDRHDPEAEIMQEAADPLVVLEALQENLASELASGSAKLAKNN